MYCNQCGREVPNGSKFCQYCGAKIEAVEQEEAKKLPIKIEFKPKAGKEKKPKVRKQHKKSFKWIVAAICAVSVLLVCVGIYFGTYSMAKKNALEGNFSKASSLLILPVVTEKHDPLLDDYIEAGILLENNNFNTAIGKFTKLGTYLDSNLMVEETFIRQAENKLTLGRYYEAYCSLRSAINRGSTKAEARMQELLLKFYDHAKSLYTKKEYSSAKLLFMELASDYKYKDSAKYLNLCIAHGFNYYDFDNAVYSNLLKNINFADTKKILVSNDNFATRFLAGDWRTEKNNYSFKIWKSSDSGYYMNHTMPRSNLPNSSWSIEDGILYLYNETSRLDMFSITVRAKDSISIYCYKDGKNYTMYRQ